MSNYKKAVKNPEMKILHIIYAVGISGAERYIIQLLPGLKHDYGYDCHLMLICPHEKSQAIEDFNNQMIKEDIKTTVIIAGYKNFLAAARKVANYCVANEIEIIHSHLLKADLIAAIVKRCFNKNIFLVSTKNGYQESVLQEYDAAHPVVRKNFYHLLTRMVVSTFNNNIAVSEGIANLFLNLQLTKNKFSVVHHGINVDAVDKAEAIKTHKEANIQLAIVGRIEKFKGHIYLIQAMTKVVELFPECKLLILGDGSLAGELKAQVKMDGLEGNVHFLGFQKNPYSYIAASDVVVLPSLFEPFGLVYIEAFSLQVPVVAFDTPAGNEIIKHGETGLLGPRADSDKLAQNIIYLLQNPEERKRLSANAYEDYKKRFTTSTMIKNTAAWYDSNLPGIK
jgi:glycosyltransferase involved in cell wall biosynthesis